MCVREGKEARALAAFGGYAWYVPGKGTNICWTRAALQAPAPRSLSLHVGAAPLSKQALSAACNLEPGPRKRAQVSVQDLCHEEA